MTRKEAIEVYNGLINTKIKEAFEFFAPELAESEDERMIKEAKGIILEHRIHCIQSGIEPSRHNRILAWLEKQKEQKPAEWGEEDKKILEVCSQYIGNTIPADYDEEEFTAKDCRNWLKSLPERFNLQPKQEWSEKDDRIRDRALFYVHYYQKNNGVTDGSKECVDWLKSLRPSWKPSEEQIGVLWDVISNLKYDGYKRVEIVESLYERLKSIY